MKINRSTSRSYRPHTGVDRDRPRAGAARHGAAAVPTKPGLSVKPIEAIEVGDLVWAWDPATGRLVKRPVRQLFRRTGRAVLDVICVSEDGTQQTICVTAEHPFWVQDEGWKAAKELEAGDRLEPIDARRWTRVLAVSNPGRSTDVFNFEVVGAHNYFVGRAGVLVHNHSELLGDTTPVTSVQIVPEFEVGVFHAPRRNPPEDWNHITPEMTAYVRRIAAQSVGLVPTNYRKPIRLANGQMVSPVITSIDFDPRFEGGKGAQKAYRVLDGGRDAPFRMGISMNLPGIHPVNVLYEGTLIRTVGRYVPNYDVETVLPVVQPRVEGIGRKARLVFDREIPPNCQLGLGLVTEAGPAYVRMGKAKVFLGPLSETNALDDVPGVQAFGQIYGKPSAAIFVAVATNDSGPLLAAVSNNLEDMVAEYPQVNEGARPLIAMTRDMVDKHGIAIVDYQVYPMRKQEWTNSIGEKHTVNFGNIDPGGLVFSGQQHPLFNSATGVEGIPFDFEHTGRYMLLTAEIMERMVNLRSGTSRPPRLVFSFGASPPVYDQEAASR